MYRIVARLATRKIIQPQTATVNSYGDVWRVTSSQHQFAIHRKPTFPLIYQHGIDTPAAVLKKPGIHILPSNIPQINITEKIAAVTRQLQDNYRKAYRNCKAANEIFHMQRKVQASIQGQLWFIGTTEGQKYQHLLLYKSHMELAAQRTLKQYQQKGVEVEALGGKKIYPKGHVWMPTSSRYLTHYQDIIKNVTVAQGASMLDLGCGSGVLGFLFAKQNKKSRVVGVDANADAVQTTNINAAGLSLGQVQAVRWDICGKERFEDVMRMNQLPVQYDWVVVNPPWLTAKPVGENELGKGVCDEKGKMLVASFSLAKSVLKPGGKLVVIYSDLSNLLQLKGPTIEQLALNSNFTIEEKLTLPLYQGMAKVSPLQQYKNKASILTYVLSQTPS